MYPVFRKRTTKIGEKSDTKGSFCSTGRFLLLTTSVFLFIFFAPPPPLLVVLFIHLDCFGVSCRVLEILAAETSAFTLI